METNHKPFKKAQITATIAGALICCVFSWFSLEPFWYTLWDLVGDIVPSDEFHILASLIFYGSSTIYSLFGGITARIILKKSIDKDGFIGVGYSVAKAIILDVAWSLIALGTAIFCYNFNFGFGYFVGTIIGYPVAVIGFAEPIKKILLKIQSSKVRRENMAGKTAKSTAASSMKIIARISWLIITICGGVAGFFIGDAVVGEITGMVIGLIVGALAGFLANLFLLYLAELGQNTAKTAANSGGNQPTSVADEIQKYKDMLDSGVITQQEFEDLKYKLIQK